MENVGLYALVPLAGLLVGAAAGLLAGRHGGTRGFLWLLGLASLVALVIIIRLAAVGEGEEEKAFLPFALLTGVLFPGIFGIIVGGLGGRALARRGERRG